MTLSHNQGHEHYGETEITFVKGLDKFMQDRSVNGNWPWQLVMKHPYLWRASNAGGKQMGDDYLHLTLLLGSPRTPGWPLLETKCGTRWPLIWFWKVIHQQWMMSCIQWLSIYWIAYQIFSNLPDEWAHCCEYETLPYDFTSLKKPLKVDGSSSDDLR